MPTKGQVLLAIVLLVVFIVGLVLWGSIYFEIYYPLLHRTWTPANCTITEVRSLETAYAFHQKLVVYSAVVEEDNRTWPGLGYSCSSSAYNAAIATDGADGYYPYKYRDCSNMHLIRGNCNEGEIILPNWLCSAFTYTYEVGNRVECKYYINGNDHADTYSYPQAGQDFLEVLYQDEIYIPMGDYIALWTCAFGLMCVLPCLVSPCVVGIGLGWWSRAERRKCRDFYHRFLCCRRKRIPICLQEIGELLGKIPPTPIIVWLFFAKKRAHFPVKSTFVREIADFLA